MRSFCPDGGFLVLSALGLCFGSGEVLLVLGWFTIDVVLCLIFLTKQEVFLKGKNKLQENIDKTSVL